MSFGAYIKPKAKTMKQLLIYLNTRNTDVRSKSLNVFFLFLLCGAAGIPTAAAASTAGFPFSDAAWRESLRSIDGSLEIHLPAGKPGTPDFPLIYKRSLGKITVGINPNRELLYAILHLTKYSENLRAGRQSQPIVSLVLQEFAAYSGHPAVVELDHSGKLNWNKGLCYDAFSAYPGYFSALPEGRRLYDYEDSFLQRVLPGMSREQKIEYLDAYWEKVMDFYRMSGFAGFFEKNSGLYQAYVNNVYDNLPKTDPVKLHEDFHANYGFTNFYVVPSPLNLPTGGNYGWRIGTDIFNFMGYGFSDPWAVKFLILHEFGHSFCNPVVEKYIEDIYAYEGLMKGVAEEMEAMAYRGWNTVMRELLVRSVHARLLLKMDGKEAAERYLLGDTAQKFVFIRDFYDLLGVYEKNRSTYPTLYEFYPRLIESLGNWELAEVTETVNPGIWSSSENNELVITGLNTNCYGYEAGLRWGDIVTAVDGKKPSASFFFSLEPGRTYNISVTRSDGSSASVIFTTPCQKKLRPIKKDGAAVRSI
jgi:hypothetical protein